MRRLSISVVLLASLATTASAKKVSISMIASNATEHQLPVDVFALGKWQPRTDAEFVKIHMYLDEEVTLSKIEVKSCAGPFSSNIGVYVNFDENVASVKGGGTTLTQTYKTPVVARSVTLNFRENREPCVGSIRFFDEQGTPYDVKVADAVAGTVTASNTLKPAASYHVMNLFDSRFEYAWSTDKKLTGVSLDFVFDDEQTIDKLKIWNGYQRSDSHCFSNARVKKLKIEGDNGYLAEVALADIMGAQVVPLDKPFVGKTLKMTISDAYPGKRFRSDVNISELRFGQGDRWFMLSPLATLTAFADANRAEFGHAKAVGVLDQSLSGESVSQKAGWGNWTVRLRSDGSFFIEGEQTKEGKEKAEFRSTFALGNYEIKARSESLVSLRVFGLLRVDRRIEDMDMDCNGCGRDCNQSQSKNDGELIFSENVDLRVLPDGYEIINKSKRHLGFSKLELKLTP